MKKTLISLFLGAATAASAQVTLQNATLWQNPQTRVVEVTYELAGSEPVYITLGIETNGIPIPPPVTLIGDVTTTQNPVAVEPDTAPKKIYWNAKQDWPGNLTTDARAVVTAWFTDDPPANLASYVVVDLSDGPSAPWYPVWYSVAPPDLGDNTCRTNELWLRRIPAGTFMMGSPTTETGRIPEREDLHEVTLTQDFYIGVFPVTQAQYELVMGTNPSQYTGDLRPVEMVSYNMIRGTTLGAQWPANNNVDATSFMGLLRAKTGLTFDLPTDAQWEYACRAGTTSALYTGKDLTGTSTCPNVAEIARYAGNAGSGQHTTMGSYLPNVWGLYDMCGNVNEWCLDWYVEGLGTSPVTDPKGPTSGSNRVRRNSSYTGNAASCRSAYRASATFPSSTNYQFGFRAAIQP